MGTGALLGTFSLCISSNSFRASASLFYLIGDWFLCSLGHVLTTLLSFIADIFCLSVSLSKFPWKMLIGWLSLGQLTNTVPINWSQGQGHGVVAAAVTTWKGGQEFSEVW